MGPSRVGKTTLSSILCEKYNLNYISGDSIRNAFINIYPVLGYTPKNTIERIEFCKFINWLIKENNVHLKRDIYYVIDSADISLDNAIQIFDDAIIIGVGCKDITIQDMIEKMKKMIPNLNGHMDTVMMIYIVLQKKQLLIVKNYIKNV